jgi:hypothetical protein
MQSPKDINNSFRSEISCEIIQEIYGLGPYYLLREDEEVLFNRLFAKYQHHACKPNEVKGDEGDFKVSIRKAISGRKAELTGGFYKAPQRKEPVLSGRVPRGSADKDAVESARAIRRMHLG